MKVLVTGGAGYIGSHACKALAKAGFSPISFDDLSHGHDWAVKWGPLIRGNLADTDKLIESIESHCIEAVLHFAAFTSVAESVRDPGRYYQNNVSGSLNLLHAMARTGVSKIVFSSTAATYGTPIQTPIDEEHPQNPINPYGMSKLIVERMLADFSGAHGIRSAALRYFNAAGADPDGEIGEAHAPETHLIPLAIDAALGRRPPLSIFGEDYATSDGTCVRDYIHVSDLADAHVLALKSLDSNPVAMTCYNLGNGNGFSVREVLSSIEQVSGRKVPYRIETRRPGDPAILIADSAKAKTELYWRPRFTQLEAIVETAWKWTRSR